MRLRLKKLISIQHLFLLTCRRFAQLGRLGKKKFLNGKIKKTMIFFIIGLRKYLLSSKFIQNQVFYTSFKVRSENGAFLKKVVRFHLHISREGFFEFEKKNPWFFDWIKPWSTLKKKNLIHSWLKGQL